jgi:hypothetical protein
MAKGRFKAADFHGDPNDAALREALARPVPDEPAPIVAPPKVPQGIKWGIKPVRRYGR